ncbi:hypothetical protein SeMB42_g00829 [Synchytrium endobioticum]|uniref:Uncharacterized protein n=1 Tax=Synchytrium endobioticum TaxID=286115 RepID=A0A507DR05_9FUNG|nr:hypothetical protein SeMB42_g00829 [Synchytrium endobioticum]
MCRHRFDTTTIEKNENDEYTRIMKCGVWQARQIVKKTRYDEIITIWYGPKWFLHSYGSAASRNIFLLCTEIYARRRNLFRTVSTSLCASMINTAREGGGPIITNTSTAMAARAS